jgi:hypothetical protein
MSIVEVTEKNEAELIENGRAIAEMLSSAPMKRLLGALREQFIAEWKQGKSVDEREKVHAKMTFLDDFANGAVMAINHGTLATNKREQRLEHERRNASTRK